MSNEHFCLCKNRLLLLILLRVEQRYRYTIKSNQTRNLFAGTNYRNSPSCPEPLLPELPELPSTHQHTFCNSFHNQHSRSLSQAFFYICPTIYSRLQGRSSASCIHFIRLDRTPVQPVNNCSKPNNLSQKKNISSSYQTSTVSLHQDVIRTEIQIYNQVKSNA